MDSLHTRIYNLQKKQLLLSADCETAIIVSLGVGGEHSGSRPPTYETQVHEYHGEFSPSRAQQFLKQNAAKRISRQDDRQQRSMWNSELDPCGKHFFVMGSFYENELCWRAFHHHSRALVESLAR